MCCANILLKEKLWGAQQLVVSAILHWINYFQLPSTEPIIEELFCEKVQPVWSDFITQLLGHTHASQKLVHNVVEKCNDDILECINSRVDLCQIISSKIDWNDAEDNAMLMLMLLMKLAAKFNKQITEFYTVLCLTMFNWKIWGGLIHGFLFIIIFYTFFNCSAKSCSKKKIFLFCKEISYACFIFILTNDKLMLGAWILEKLCLRSFSEIAIYVIANSTVFNIRN